MTELERERPVRWRNGWSVLLAVDTPGVHFPRQAIPKDFTMCCVKQVVKFACCLLGQSTFRDASTFMWQIGGRTTAVQSLVGLPKV